MRGSDCRGHTYCAPPQGGQRDSPIPVVRQCPMLRAVITKPVVLDAPLLLPGTNKRRRSGFSRFRQAIRLDQKQFALSEPEEGLAALWIGASAEHFSLPSAPLRTVSASDWIPNRQHVICHRVSRRNAWGPQVRCSVLIGTFSPFCRLIGNPADAASLAFLPEFC